MKERINLNQLTVVEIEIRTRLNSTLTYDTFQHVYNVPVLSISALVYMKDRSDIWTGGQCYNEIARLFPNDAAIHRLVEIWREYHLNDMMAGTKAQVDCIENEKAKGWKYDFKQAREILTKANLLSESGIEYGTRSLYKPIPESVINELQEICSLYTKK